MRNFDYITNPAKLLTPEIVQMVGSIHEHKGKQELFLEWDWWKPEMPGKKIIADVCNRSRK